MASSRVTPAQGPPLRPRRWGRPELGRSASRAAQRPSSPLWPPQYAAGGHKSITNSGRSGTVRLGLEPQADLQAMDRCHRIGQTNGHGMTRTEQTVEEKIIERAHQKLKLDAVVVQSGRLQDASKKLQTAELLKAVRFGADKVFRANDELRDEDIDAIIERGRKRTDDINKRLEEASKGDCWTSSWTGA